jgi:hypothetical protein
MLSTAPSIAAPSFAQLHADASANQRASQNIADTLKLLHGMTLETVSRALSNLARDKVIAFAEKSRRDVSIPDVARCRPSCSAACRRQRRFIERCVTCSVCTREVPSREAMVIHAERAMRSTDQGCRASERQTSFSCNGPERVAASAPTARGLRLQASTPAAGRTSLRRSRECIEGPARVVAGLR